MFIKIEIDNDITTNSPSRNCENMFDKCMKDMFNKANANFKKFSEKIMLFDQEMYSKYEIIKNYLYN